MNRGTGGWQGRPVGGVPGNFPRPTISQLSQFGGLQRQGFSQPGGGQFGNPAWTGQPIFPNLPQTPVGNMPFQQTIQPGLLPTPSMYNQGGMVPRLPFPGIPMQGSIPMQTQVSHPTVAGIQSSVTTKSGSSSSSNHSLGSHKTSKAESHSQHSVTKTHSHHHQHSRGKEDRSDASRQVHSSRKDHHHHHHHHHHQRGHRSPVHTHRKDETRHHSSEHRHHDDASHHQEHHSHRRYRKTDSRDERRDEEKRSSRQSDGERHRKRNLHETGDRTRESRHKEHSSDSHEHKKRKRQHEYERSSESPSSRRSRWSHLEKEIQMKTVRNPSSSSSASVAKETKEADVKKKPHWIRCTPMENYYSNDPMDQKHDSTVAGTSNLRDLYCKIRHDLLQRGERCKENICAKIPNYSEHKCHHKVEVHISDSESSSSESDDSESDNEDNLTFEQMNEMRRKKAHPLRLHQELWFNEPGEMNDGPLCKCSYRAKQTGIRHNIYPGEESISHCDPLTNNIGRLYHYRVTVSPGTNFLSDRPTVIEYDEHEYIFEGFSMFSHYPLDNFPECNVIRFNIEYNVLFLKEPIPENFCVEGIDHFCDFLFEEILELYDFDLKDPNGCRRYHFMPRFVRSLPDNGKEVLSMHQVLLYLLRSNRPLLEDSALADMIQMDEIEWQNIAEETKNMIVTCPGKKPSSLRIDQLDREQNSNDVINYPVIVHFGIRPAQLSYAGDPGYQKLFKAYLKMRHLLANRPKVTHEDRLKLQEKEDQLQKLRSRGSMKREVTVELSSEGMLKTGIRSDVCQHAMMLPVLVQHLRYFACLHTLDAKLQYTFKDRALFKLAMTHPSHHLNFGMNPDHVRNSMSNCGIRQPEYGDRRIHHEHTRKKGINTLINIMSRMASDDEIKSRIQHNERLEFLGDAVLEFVTSTHLYYLFPLIEEGGLATYRMALVQNQYLAVLAKKLDLDHYMLYAHGPDLCHTADLRHAMANCFEALMGALYIEAGLDKVRDIFCNLLFNEEEMRKIWMNHPKHPLQLQEPDGDRHLIESSPVLKKLTQFEESTGIEFNHIRLLARSFTQRTVGFTNLTLGHNQRLEFLGDSAMQLVASEYLFKHFPDHHEGHLSLLRSSLVNNRTQATVSQDLGMEEYIINFNRNREKEKPALRVKVLADLLEAFLGALYVDRDIERVRVFCEVCFFPRLTDFIMNQDWNDPKSQLQQCCLTLRTEGKEPDIPIYKIVNQIGPSHLRKYTVAVYFKNERLASGSWSSVQQAEMNAAKNALDNYQFPQLKHQKKFIEHKYKKPKQKDEEDKE
ncbi:ribonuclease 3-like [Glandiceps talaboti]